MMVLATERRQDRQVCIQLQSLIIKYLSLILTNKTCNHFHAKEIKQIVRGLKTHNKDLLSAEEQPPLLFDAHSTINQNNGKWTEPEKASIAVSLCITVMFTTSSVKACYMLRILSSNAIKIKMILKKRPFTKY